MPDDKQREMLEFIAFLNARQGTSEPVAASKTVEEIEAFFRSFKVDVSGYKFDRDEANAG